MRILPEDMRGHAFAVLRTIMQAGAPMGGLAAGWLLPRADVRVVMLLSAALAGVPGLLGARVRALGRAGSPDEVPGREAR